MRARPCPDTVASGGSYAQAARAIGVSSATLFIWSKHADFISVHAHAYDEARQRLRVAEVLTLENATYAKRTETCKRQPRLKRRAA